MTATTDAARRVLIERPAGPEAWSRRIGDLRSTGDLRGAFRALARLRVIDRHAPAAYLAAAPLLTAVMVDPAAYFTLGERTAKRAVVLTPGDSVAWMTLIGLYRGYEPDFLRRAVTALGCLAPADPGPALLVAGRLAELGDDRSSRRLAERALLIDPASLQAVADQSEAAPPKRSRLLGTIARHTAQAETRSLGPAVAARLVVARLAHACGGHETAWRAVREANALRWRVVASNASSFVSRAEGVVAACARLPAARARARQHLILLAGLPRSGTTLAERRIASATTAFALGETGLLELAFNRIAGGQLTPDRAAGRLDRAIRSVTEARWVIEKMPLALVYRGLAERLFADTKLVLTVRPFLANFLSGHFIDYADRMPFFADLETFAGVYRFYLTQLRATVAVRPPSEVGVVPLERLAADPGGTTDRLVERLGLDRRSDGEAPAIVRTASLRSVRTGVARDHPDQYAPYEPLFDPAARRLVETVEAERVALLASLGAHLV